MDFLESRDSFESFYEDAVLSEEDKHRILIASQVQLQKHANCLNSLLNNHNIPVDQRVVYVSGMLLAMQDIIDYDGNRIDVGLVPDDLKGIQTATKRDGVKIVNQIKEYLEQKEIPQQKRELMLGSFLENLYRWIVTEI